MKTNNIVTALRLGSTYYQEHRDCEEETKELGFVNSEMESLKENLLFIFTNENIYRTFKEVAK